MDAKPSADDINIQSSKSKKRLCDRCDRLVSIRTYNAHKRRKATPVVKGKHQCKPYVILEVLFDVFVC